MQKMTLALAAATVVLAACSHTAPTAPAATASAAPALPPLTSAGGTYVIEPTHTFVTFEARHFGTSTNRGRFDGKSGTVEFNPQAKTGKVDVTIDMNSVSTGTPPFDKHLKSKDFFDAEANPQARFVSTALGFKDGRITEVAGNLTFRGVTKPVTLKATNFNCFQHPMLKREVCGGDFETTIKRSEFGSTYGLPGIPDNVRLLIQAEAIRQ